MAPWGGSARRSRPARRVRRSAGECGFTLIEAVFSILILTIIGGVAVTMLSTSLRDSGGARQQDVATSLAEQQLEEIRAQPPQSLSNYHATTATTVLNGTTYTVSPTLTAEDGLTSSSSTVSGTFYWAQVTVTWPGNDYRGITGKVVDGELVCGATTC